MIKKICLPMVLFFGYVLSCERDEQALSRDAGINGLWSRRRIQKLLAKNITHGCKLNLDCIGADGLTPLMKATVARRDHVTQLLLNAGATPGFISRDKTALALLFEQEPREKDGNPDIRYAIAKLLLDAEHNPAHVADYLAREEKRHAEGVFSALILQARTRISRELASKNRALLALAGSGDSDSVKAYLPKVFACDVLIEAIKQEKVASIITLIRAGVNPNLPSTACEYPLLAAMQTGNHEVLTALTNGGARWDIVNWQLREKLRNPASLEELEKLVSLCDCVDGFCDMIQSRVFDEVAHGHTYYLPKLLPAIVITEGLFNAALQLRRGPGSTRASVLNALATFSINKDEVQIWLSQAQEHERKELAQQEEERKQGIAEREEDEWERQEREAAEWVDREPKPWDDDTWRDRYRYPHIQPSPGPDDRPSWEERNDPDPVISAEDRWRMSNPDAPEGSVDTTER